MTKVKGEGQELIIPARLYQLKLTAVILASDTMRLISGSFPSFSTDSGAWLKSLTHPGPGSPAHARRLIEGVRIPCVRTHRLTVQNELQGKMKENRANTCRPQVILVIFHPSGSIFLQW